MTESISLKERRLPMMDITTRLAGVSYGEAQANVKMFGCEDIPTYELVREADNPHDPNAVSVRIGPYHLGYIRKDVAKEVASKMDAGRKFRAEFVCRNEHPLHDTVGLTIRIVEMPAGPVQHQAAV